MPGKGPTLKLVTRAQLGWPASAAPTQTTTKGVKVHYEGTAVSTRLLTDHDACITEWKAIRKSHLANTVENYSDIAYNYGACPHGYLLEGRGLRKRTGANGNQPLNIAHYAIVGLVGSEGLTKPTDAMLNAIRDGIELLRRNGAGTEIKGHRDGYATACPGPDLYAWVQKGAPRPADPAKPATNPKPETDMDLSDQITLGAWVKEQWPDDDGLTDGKIAVNTALGSGYAHARRASDNTTAILAQLGAQKATIDELVKAVATLAAGVGDLDPAAIVTELKQAIESIDIRLDVPDA